MSNANLKLMQDADAAFGRGDIPFILETLSPDITMGIVGREEDAPFLGIRNGKASAAEFFAQLNEAHEIHSFEPLRYLAAEDMVFIWGRYEWTMRKSRVSRQSEWFHAIAMTLSLASAGGESSFDSLACARPISKGSSSGFWESYARVRTDHR